MVYYYKAPQYNMPYLSRKGETINELSIRFNEDNQLQTIIIQDTQTRLDAIALSRLKEIILENSLIKNVM